MGPAPERSRESCAKARDFISRAIVSLQSYMTWLRVVLLAIKI